MVWERHQRKLISELMKKIKDGCYVADSPGHSAKCSSYSIIELSKNKVLDLILIQVTAAS